jgi:uncharacterized protein (TIGR00725 family)
MAAEPRPYIAVIGPGVSATAEHLSNAYALGAALAGAGAVVLTGGHGGVMQAAAAGCASAGGASIGILPDRDRTRANPDTTFTIPTGMGELRNGLLVRSADAVVCVALSWGTLSEVALAVRSGVPVVALGGWDLPLDGPIPVATAPQAAQLVLELAIDRIARSGPAEIGYGPASTAASTATSDVASELASDVASDDPDLRAPPIHHLTLTVIDVERSAAWYQSLLGPAATVRRKGPGWVRVRMQWSSGLVIGVTAHGGTPADDGFAHERIGLDHVGLACRDEAEVRRWAQRLDSIGAPRGPVEDVPYGWAVTGRDPDGIPVEFFTPR